MTFPDIETTTRHASSSHFLLMLGYKIFAFFFPLFLFERGFSLPQIGYTYLLIYLSMVLLVPLAGALNHRTNPAVLAASGIGGYALYSLLMLSGPGELVFFAAQILLGGSAALFFVSSRTLLISSHPKNPDSSFGWFYSAPIYGEAFAPVLGALVIWQFGFVGVFILSFLIHAGNMIFTLRTYLRDSLSFVPERTRTLEAIHEGYRTIARGFQERKVAPFLLISFAILLLLGIYRPFFIPFLLESGWTDQLVLLYGAVFALVFTPISLMLIRYLETHRSATNVMGGAALYGISSILFAFGAPLLHMAGVLLIMLVRGAGGIMANAGRSGLLSQRFAKQPIEIATVDTIFAPLGSAIGSLAGGVLIGLLGFVGLFAGGGVFLLLAAFLVWLLFRRWREKKDS